MKKILIILGVIGLLAAASCDTPQPATDQSGADSTMNNNNTQPDTTMNRPDSTQNP